MLLFEAETRDMKASVANFFVLVLQGASALFLRWYISEVRTLDIPLAPDEAIHTYPLA